MLAAWLFTLTLDTGRVFNYPVGRFVFATQPGIEVSCGPLTINANLAYDRQGYFERDLTVSMSREVSKRLTISAQAARFDYPGYDADMTASVSLRWRLK